MGSCSLILGRAFFLPLRQKVIAMRRLVALGALVFALPANAAPMFTGLGDIPGGEFHSRPVAMSGDGSVVVGWSFSDDTSGDGREAFRWNAAEGMVALGRLPGGIGYSVALGISDDGNVIVGGSASPIGNQPVWWTSSTGWVPLESADPFTPGDLVARDISGDGSVIVGMGATPLGGQAFRWTAATGMVALGGSEAGFRSVLGAISDDGSVIVGNRYWVDGTCEVFRWTLQDGMVGLGDLPGGRFSSQQPGVSPDGSIVVGSSISGAGYEAFRWTATEGMVGLGDLVPTNFASEATAVSGNGVIVGHSGFDTDPDGQAFIWDERNGMRSLQGVLSNDLGLDLTGWSLRHATAISSDGTTIIGYGHNPNSDWEAWIAVLGCGDAIVQEPEECDDGNHTSGDTCSSTCTVEPPIPACADGIDNDSDGFIDYPADAGCGSATSALENPQCNDGADNDGDGLIDLTDPQCSGPTDPTENPIGGGFPCGIGPELAFLLPILRLLYRRRAGRASGAAR